jgi:hypothetical protein
MVAWGALRGSRPSRHDQALRAYLRAEHQDKKGSPLDLDGWTDDQAPQVRVHPH